MQENTDSEEKEKKQYKESDRKSQRDKVGQNNLDRNTSRTQFLRDLALQIYVAAPRHIGMRLDDSRYDRDK
jgi:hypothetical protein